jgi:hypothetical protein
MKNYLLLLLLPAALMSCKGGEKEPEPAKDFISVVSLVREQVAQVDTSLFSIMKVVQRDSLSDTSYIPREEFAREAKDFLEVPDLSDPEVAKRYKADPVINDETLKRVIFTYLPVDPDKEEVKKQEVLATPVLGGNARINNIIITREISTRDSFMQKKMLWQVGRSFQVVTTTQKPGSPEITTTTKITWNDNEGF